MPSRADVPGQPYDEAYYRETYGRDLARRMPQMTREQYWARWVRRRVGAAAGPVIDLGSGLGWFALGARAQGLAPLSLDISEFSARRLQAEHDLPVVVGSATAVPIRPASASAVVALDVLEHIEQPDVALGEIRRAVRREGVLILSVPNTDGYGARHKRAAGTWFADRDHTHTALWSPDAWIRAIVDAGFVLERRGSDWLWDVPYPGPVPEQLQRAALLPLHRIAARARGALPWRAGENLVLVGRAE